MIKYIKFPKIISKNEYDLSESNFFEYKILKKEKNFLYLLHENQFNKKNFWLITDIVQTIYKKYGNCIFLLCDLNEDNLEIIYGVTTEVIDTTFFAKETINIKDESLKKSTEVVIKNKVEFLKNYFDHKTIRVFYIDKNSIEFIKNIFIDDKLLFDNADYIFKTTQIESKKTEKYKPFFISFVVILSLFIVMNKYTSDIIQKQKTADKKAEIELKKELKAVNRINKRLKNEIAKKEKELSGVKEVINKYYTGDRNVRQNN